MTFVKMVDLKQRKLTLVNQLSEKIKQPLLLRKGHEIDLKSAVAIVICKNHILLGLAKADDERDGKWCFPGGGIDKGEDTMSAAIREAYEEMGVSALPVSQVLIIHPAKPMVGFVFLHCSDLCEIEHNEEFLECKWFPIKELPEEMLSINKDILKLLI